MVGRLLTETATDSSDMNNRKTLLNQLLAMTFQSINSGIGFATFHVEMTQCYQ